jgi:endonuclease YncB( thermonuclease family)
MPMPVLAAMLACTVIGVADGDSLTARCDVPGGRVNITVRVAEIDAPEKGQAWGNRSKQHLAALCFQQPAVLRPQTTDRYGRTVARVECDGVDASAEQVRAGMAWVFDRYVSDRRLYSAQDEARAAVRGLWADSEAVAPWESRKAASQRTRAVTSLPAE